MPSSIQSVTDFTRLAVTNQSKDLMFRLEANENQDETELFGINVFKVRELIESPVRNIKDDKRFNGIPMMMHSSLSADENIRIGMKAGADSYMPKRRPMEFIAQLVKLINEAASKARAEAA